MDLMACALLRHIGSSIPNRESYLNIITAHLVLATSWLKLSKADNGQRNVVRFQGEKDP